MRTENKPRKSTEPNMAPISINSLASRPDLAVRVLTFCDIQSLNNLRTVNEAFHRTVSEELRRRYKALQLPIHEKGVTLEVARGPGKRGIRGARRLMKQVKRSMARNRDHFDTTYTGKKVVFDWQDGSNNNCLYKYGASCGIWYCGNPVPT